MCLLPAIATSLVGQRPAGTTRSDTSLFAAVVRGIPAINVWGEMSVVVDPTAADGGMMGAGAAPPAIDDAGRRARSEALQRFGVPIAADIDLHGRPGYFVADSIDGRCPATRSTRVAIGLPRPVVGGRIPAPDGRAEGASTRADMVVRLVFAYLAPYGSAMSEADYYLGRDDIGWRVVARRTLAVSH